MTRAKTSKIGPPQRYLCPDCGKMVPGHGRCGLVGRLVSSAPAVIGGNLEDMVRAGVDLAAIATILDCPFAAVVATKRRLSNEAEAAKEERMSMNAQCRQQRIGHAELCRRAAKERARTRLASRDTAEQKILLSKPQNWHPTLSPRVMPLQTHCPCVNAANC